MTINKLTVEEINAAILALQKQIDALKHQLEKLSK